MRELLFKELIMEDVVVVNETKSIWNKTAQEITVKDQVVISAVALGVVVGISVAIGAAGSIAEKFHCRKNRKNIVTTEVVEAEVIEPEVA
jgi:hypothetical protein